MPTGQTTILLLKQVDQMNKKITIITISMAALLIISCSFSYLTGTYAAINFSTNISPGQVSVYMMENGIELVKDNNHQSNIFTNSLIISETIKPNKKYNAAIGFINKGTIPAYIRAQIDKCWVDNNGEKDIDLEENYINIEYNTIDPLDGPNNGTKGWIEIDYLRTDERNVFLYNYAVDPSDSLSDGRTIDLIKSIKIDDQVLTAVSYNVDSNTGEVTTIYRYNDMYIELFIEGDAVQNSQPVNSIRSAWGITPIFQNNFIIGYEDWNGQ